jgi:hypothetical protein
MEQADMRENSRPARWIKNLADIAVIVLIVVAAKTAIARTVLRAVRLDGAHPSHR